MKSKPIAGLAIAASALLVLSGCASGPAPTPTTTDAPSEGLYLDPVAEEIPEAGAQRITELYEAALAAGETELSIISGLADDMLPTWDLFEETFPGIKVTYASLIGGPLITQLQTEAQSGNHVTDVLHNPNGQQYVDFAQPYEVVSLVVPDALKSSATELQDPEHMYSAPFIGFFGIGAFLPREQAQGVTPPKLWSDLTAPEMQGLVVMGDPNLPGPSQDAPIYLSQNGAFTESDIEALAKNVIIKGTYGDAIAALMQGEAVYMFAAPSTALISAGRAGAPVEFRLMEKDNYVVTHKQLILEGAPHPNAAKLYVEWLNTLSAQENLGAAGHAPLNTNGADPDAPWTNWVTANVTSIVAAADIDAARPGFIEKFKTIFAQ